MSRRNYTTTYVLNKLQRTSSQEGSDRRFLQEGSATERSLQEGSCREQTYIQLEVSVDIFLARGIEGRA